MTYIYRDGTILPRWDCVTPKCGVRNCQVLLVQKHHDGVPRGHWEFFETHPNFVRTHSYVLEYTLLIYIDTDGDMKGTVDSFEHS